LIARGTEDEHPRNWGSLTRPPALLAGANSGQLGLSPHIDHLFDEGYITFSSPQRLLIVPEVLDKLLDAWGIDAGVSVGNFSREQNAYLDYHRANVFKHALL
jgi:putative restriction endonuclease